MFCSWRKSPSAPCSCACRLHGSVTELLNHLCCLGQGTLVIRQQGLSLAKSTLFGLWVSSRESGWHTLRDHISGLEVDTRRPQNIYLLTGHGDRRPLIAIGEPGKPVHLSIRLDGHLWESRSIRNLIDHFQGTPLDCVESRRLGAGAWLDEWERPACPAAPCNRLADTRFLLERCTELEVGVATASHKGTVRFRPSFIDASGSVLRIADRPLRHVVHADAGDPGFLLQSTGPSRLRISHTLGEAA